jgi:hypothetical protein
MKEDESSDGSNVPAIDTSSPASSDEEETGRLDSTKGEPSKPNESLPNNSQPGKVDNVSNSKPSDLSNVAEAPRCSKPAKHQPTRIVLDRGQSGKVEVMLGPRYKLKKAWKPKTAANKKGDGYDLLGNVQVGKWDDNDGTNGTGAKQPDRSKLVQQIDRKECARKRKMQPDRWDAALDQGKVSVSCYV